MRRRLPQSAKISIIATVKFFATLALFLCVTWISANESNDIRHPWLLTPTVNGPDTLCETSWGNTYITEAGMTGYNWSLSGGGMITTGGGTNTITVTWTTVGTHTVSVTYNTASQPGTLDVVVKPVLTVSVTISASATIVCAGTPVVFTATPTNGGTAPLFQWKVNGINVGANSPTCTFTPANGDIVNCQLISSELCTTGNAALSNSISLTVNPNLPVSINITASANPVCQGTFVTYTATPFNGGSSPLYQWKVNGTNVGTNSPSFTYLPLDGDIVTCTLTSNAVCATGSPAISNPILMTVSGGQPVSISITASANPACQGSSVTFTSVQSNGGSAPVYEWKVNGIVVGGNTPTYSYIPVDGDLVKCKITSNANCLMGVSTESNAIAMVVATSVPVSVSISATANPICQGTAVTFTALPVNGGATPAFQWVVNGFFVGTNNSTYTYSPANGDVVSCQLLSSITCATGNPAVSAPINMTVNPTIPVFVLIAASANPVCQGSSVTFTATPYNGGTSPMYQWMVNGVNVGSNSPNYTYIPLNGDVVSCQMTSNAPCTSVNTATSNSVTINVSPILPVSLTITASANPVCQGSPVIFMATPVNGGTSPSYQWKVNGTNAGTNSSSFTHTPSDNDVVSCVMTSNAGCSSGSPATSNSITMTVIPSSGMTVSVSIIASANPSCQGQPVTYTATPVNGGATPVYQWIVNGINVGTNASTYTYSPSNGDFVSCQLNSSFTCAVGNPATSNVIAMTVNPNLTVSITIVASANPTCQGNTVNYTANAVNKGTSPVYQWKVNGINAGTNQATYAYQPLNGDVVTCQVTSSVPCPVVNPVTSNAITMAVLASQPTSISIAASTNPACPTSQVTYTATPVNGGSSPLYAWKLNGNSIGGGTSSLMLIPNNGDQIYCNLTSNATCVSGSSTVQSNIITMTVGSPLEPSITIAASSNPYCTGGSVTFTATPMNGGLAPTYQWKVNCAIVGSNSPTYTYSPANGDFVTCRLTSNLSCASPSQAMSNGITMTTNTANIASVVVTASANPVCQGSPVTYTAVVTNGGSAPTYTWKVNGVATGANQPNFTYTPANNDVITCQLVSNMACVSGNPALSTPIIMTTSSSLPATISIATQTNPFCQGTGVTFTSNITNGGTTPVYEWKVNNVVSGGNSPSFTYLPANGDVVLCQLTSNASCISGSNPVSSNSITLTSAPSLPTSNTILESGNSVCQGTPVNFTSTVINSGSTPLYQWKVNGSNAGSNLASFSYQPVNGDIVTCNVTSSLSCATGNPSTSNAVTMIVNPSVPVSVSISASANPTCQGTPVTFTATPTNPGTTPTYQWKVNCLNAGSNSSTFTYTPQNGDIVVCVLTSNAICGSAVSAISNNINMTVNPVQNVTVSIAASVNPFCSGSPVTFTATPNGGGLSPTYQWMVNSTIVGTNLPTYTYNPVNGDAVVCVLTSSATCISGSPATSNEITMVASSGLTVSISIAASANPICQGSQVGFTATVTNGGTTPVYQWKVNGANVGNNLPSYFYYPANGDIIQCVLTSNLNCATPNPATSNSVTMTVYPQLPVSISIATTQNPTCVGNTVNFTSVAANTGSAPLYRWRVNGINQGANSPTFSFVPVNGDVVTCLLVSNATCATGNPSTSNAITMMVNPNSPATVSIAASSNPVCQGTPVTYTATPFNGGTVPVYQWKVNGSNAGSNSPTFTYNPLNGDAVSCDMTSNSTCTSIINATSNIITMTVSPIQPVTISITASSNPTCLGSAVTFSSTSMNGGTSPAYQWKVNGVNVGTSNPSYTYVPVNNDIVTCRLTSNATCTTGNPATSNALTMSVSSSLPVAISIAPSTNPSCQGQAVTFSASGTNGGPNPDYYWLLNGIHVGSNSATYSYTPSNGDFVKCQLTSSFSCATENPSMSNTVNMTVNPNLPVSVSITSSSNPSCQGSPVTFTASPVNGGASPSYQWKVNGINVGTNAATYTYSPLNGDMVVCEMNSGLACSLGNPSTSNAITMTMLQPQNAGIIITPTVNPVCLGSQVTFTSSITNGGSSPAYQWKVNGGNMGGNTPTFTFTPANGDIVSCQLTSNSNCLAANPVLSAPVTMVVSTDLPVSVSITASPNPVCQGQPVTYTALPGNGGTNPSYQWIVNGINVGLNSPVYTFAPTNGDLVKCFLTSNLTCATGNPAQSNTVSVAVNPNLPVSVEIVSSSNPACVGSPVSFTATATNGGNSPAFQWKVNGLNVGAGASSHTYVPTDNDLVTCLVTSNATCITGSPAISNAISMIIGTSFPVSVSISASANQVCQGTPVTFTAMPVNIGATPLYEWMVNGIIVGTNSTIYTYVPVNADVVTCRLTSSLPCGVGNPATSNAITMVVGSSTPPSVSITVSPSANVCQGIPVTYLAAPLNGGAPTYQWYKNSLPVGANQPSFIDLPTNGDQVYVVMVSSLSCMGGNIATSNTINLTVNPTVTPSVTASVSQNNICAGTSVTFTAIPVNGGSPAYQWYKNALPVGSNLPIYTYIPANGDQVYVVMTSNLSCASNNPATSNTVSMVVNPQVTVSVSVAANQNNICAGATVTFTATPVNGGTPSYQWYKNTVPVGSNLPTYTYVPLNGDQVYVVMTSNLSCANGSPATSNLVTMIVSPMPSPTISGPAGVCSGSSGNIYTTEAGMLNYQWNISSGGVITSGAGTNAVTVTWTQLGAQTLSVIYSNSSGCTPASPAVFNVSVSPMPAPTIMGHNDLCVNSGYYDYVTEGGMVNYQWSISSGGIITAGMGTNQIQVVWNASGAQSVSVNYSNGTGCTTPTPTIFNVNVKPTPGPSGNILGNPVVCQGENGVSYMVGPIQNANTYVWTLPVGAYITAGATTNSIMVSYGQNAVSGDITVYGNNVCGNGSPSPAFSVVVNSIPPTPVASVNGQILQSSAMAGNQWYHEGTSIPGATSQTYFATLPGWYWTDVTLNSCTSDTSNHVYVTIVGIEENTAGNRYSIYPVPNDGKFTVSVNLTKKEFLGIKIYNNLGLQVFDSPEVLVSGKFERVIDLRNLPEGVYTVVFTGNSNKVIKRFVKINRT